MVVCACLQEVLPYGISGTVICTMILYFKNDNLTTLLYRHGSRGWGSVGGGGGGSGPRPRIFKICISNIKRDFY